MSCSDTSYGQPFWIEAPTNRSCTEACSSTGEDGTDLGVIRPVDGVCESGDWGLTDTGSSLVSQLSAAEAAWPNFTGTPICAENSRALDWSATTWGIRDSSTPGVASTWGRCDDAGGWTSVNQRQLDPDPAAQCAAIPGGTWTPGTKSYFPMLVTNADGASEGQWEMAPYTEVPRPTGTTCRFNDTQHYPDRVPS